MMARMMVRESVIIRRQWALVVLLAVVLSGCSGGQPAATVVSESLPTPASSPNPVVAQTLQANTAATAAWVASLQTPAPTPTDEPLPTLEPVSVEGTPPAGRVGECVASGENVVHNREGFCLVAPASWTAYNVDGGLAASLYTTPGQSISLQPNWANMAAECYLMIYISTEDSAEAHLQARHAEFATRTDLEMLSQVQMRALDGMALPGFTWSAVGGASGGVYADLLGANRLVHISYGGSQCPLEELLPVLETLRFAPS
jgi:hypothetical protein